MIESAEKLRKRAKVAYKAEQFREAAAYYQLLLQHPDNLSCSADYHEHAVALIRSGQAHEAAAVLKDAARILPGDGSIQSRLGELLLRQGRTKGALEHFREAARLSPASAETYWRLALMEKSLDNQVESDAAVDHCLAIDPTHQGAREAADARREHTLVSSEAPASGFEIEDGAFADVVQFIHNRPAEDAPPALRQARPVSRPLLTALAAASTFIVVYIWIRTSLF